MSDALSADMGAGNPPPMVEADPLEPVDVSAFVADWPESNPPMTASDKEALRLMARSKVATSQFEALESTPIRPKVMRAVEGGE